MTATIGTGATMTMAIMNMTGSAGEIGTNIVTVVATETVTGKTMMMTGNATGTVIGTVMMTVTGSVTETVIGTVTETATGSVTGTVIGSAMMTVTGSVTGTVMMTTGNATGTVIGSAMMTVTGSVTETVTGSGNSVRTSSHLTAKSSPDFAGPGSGAKPQPSKNLFA